jgi:phosphate transport system permease protein
MPVSMILCLGLLVLAGFAFADGRARAFAAAGQAHTSLHSRPNYHGWFVAICATGPALLLLCLYAAFGDRLADRLLVGALDPETLALPRERLQLVLRSAHEIVSGTATGDVDPAAAQAGRALARIDDMLKWSVAAVAAALAIVGLLLARSRVSQAFRARNHVEGVIRAVLVLCSGIAILTTFGIVLSLVFESIQFFSRISPIEFLFGLQWSPQTALRAEQVGQSGAFGAVPLFYGTFMITLIAMAVAGPIGLYAAIYLSEYASPRARAIFKPMLEVLAGIPTVVYGFFAFLTVGPAIRAAAAFVGIDAPTQSALAAGLVMGIMIIPFVSSLSDDVINAVPQTLRDGAYALGATKSETVQHVVLPAALPGVMGALLLAVSRAVGETMIVVMAAGRAANMPINPLESVTTITVQIVALLTGDQEFDSAKTLSAFALGLVLFVLTLVMNIVALRIVQKYREKYE